MAHLPGYVSGCRVGHVGEQRPPSGVLSPGQSSGGEDLPGVSGWRWGPQRWWPGPFCAPSIVFKYLTAWFPRTKCLQMALALGSSWSNMFNLTLVKLGVQVLPKKSTGRYKVQSSLNCKSSAIFHPSIDPLIHPSTLPLIHHPSIHHPSTIHPLQKHSLNTSHGPGLD